MAEKLVHSKENTGIVAAFFIRLKSRNAILYYFGLFNFCGAIVTILLSQVDTVEIMGINRWIKPTKFFLSIGIVCWTMAWYLVYLTNQKIVRRYSIRTVITMSVELVIINLAGRKRSYFAFQYQHIVGRDIVQYHGYCHPHFHSVDGLHHLPVL